MWRVLLIEVIPALGKGQTWTGDGEEEKHLEASFSEWEQRPTSVPVSFLSLLQFPCLQRSKQQARRGGCDQV